MIRGGEGELGQNEVNKAPIQIIRVFPVLGSAAVATLWPETGAPRFDKQVEPQIVIERGKP